MARPPADDPRNKVVMIRLTEAEHADAVKRAGQKPVSTWMREMLRLGRR